MQRLRIPQQLSRSTIIFTCFSHHTNEAAFFLFFRSALRSSSPVRSSTARSERCDLIKKLQCVFARKPAAALSLSLFRSLVVADYPRSLESFPCFLFSQKNTFSGRRPPAPPISLSLSISLSQSLSLNLFFSVPHRLYFLPLPPIFFFFASSISSFFLLLLSSFSLLSS